MLRPLDLAAYERYLLLERSHTPRGVRRYLRDLQPGRRARRRCGGCRG